MELCELEKYILREQREYSNTNIPNAGVGGSSPPIAIMHREGFWE
jgi:hypothetical protein